MQNSEQDPSPCNWKAPWGARERDRDWEKITRVSCGMNKSFYQCNNTEWLPAHGYCPQIVTIMERSSAKMSSTKLDKLFPSKLFSLTTKVPTDVLTLFRITLSKASQALTCKWRDQIHLIFRAVSLIIWIGNRLQSHHWGWSSLAHPPLERRYSPQERCICRKH